MGYAYIEDSSVVTERGQLPGVAARQDNGEWVMNLPAADEATCHACGWYTVVQVQRPADTDTHTTDRTVVYNAGTVTETWTSRPWTQDELDARAADANRVTAINNARASNQAYKDSASPDHNAQVGSLTDQNDLQLLDTGKIVEDWTPATAYRLDTQVTRSAQGYRSRVDHVSSASTDPTSSPETWDPVNPEQVAQQIRDRAQ